MNDGKQSVDEQKSNPLQDFIVKPTTAKSAGRTIEIIQAALYVWMTAAVCEGPLYNERIRGLQISVAAIAKTMEKAEGPALQVEGGNFETACRLIRLIDLALTNCLDGAADGLDPFDLIATAKLAAEHLSFVSVALVGIPPNIS